MDDITVLLVDDEADFLESLVRRLKLRRIKASGVNSAEEALAWLDEHTADVVVLDVKLPGMNGVEALREIKTRHPHIEVLMLTGHADLGIATTGMEQGAFDYLMKPMEIDELLYKLQDAYKNKSLREASSQPPPRAGDHD